MLFVDYVVGGFIFLIDIFFKVCYELEGIGICERILRRRRRIIIRRRRRRRWGRGKKKKREIIF